MGSWGNTDDAANSVFYAPAQFNVTANTDNQTLLFNNTTEDAIVNNMIIGQYGVSATEAANNKAITHAGWVLKTEGTGGRAGRVQYETLVAMSTITGDSDSLPPVPTITISGQPSNTSVVEPATGTFSVTASATAGTLSYQWQKAEAGNTTFANIAGATSSTYTTGATTVADDNGDVYRVVVSGTLGATPVTSANATLTVTL